MTVSEQIIQVIDALCEKFGMAIDWTSANVIPYVAMLCEKLIAYEIWTSVMWIVVMTTMTIVSIPIIKRFAPMFKKGLEEQPWYEDGWYWAIAFAVIGLAVLYVATFIVIVVQVEDIVKCVTFPEMYIFEYVQRMINSGT